MEAEEVPEKEIAAWRVQATELGRQALHVTAALQNGAAGGKVKNFTWKG